MIPARTGPRNRNGAGPGGPAGYVSPLSCIRKGRL